MKKIIVSLAAILSAYSSFASADVFGKYEGTSTSNEKCTLEIFKKRQKKESNSSINIKLNFTNRVVKRKAFEFKKDLKRFNEEVKEGSILASKEKDRAWTNYSRSEDLEILLFTDYALIATVKVKDDRWYRGEREEEETCENLKKVRDEFLGGVLVTSKGSRMGVKCLSYFEDGNCKEAKLMSKYRPGDNYSDYHIIKFEKLNMDEVRDEAYRRAGERLNSSYEEAAVAVTVNTLGSNNELLLPGALVIDAAKSPILLVAYILHKPADLIARRKMIKGFEFMLDSSKKTKEEKISSRYFTSLNNAIR